MRILVLGSTSVLARALANDFENHKHSVARAGRRGAELPIDLESASLPRWSDDARFDVVLNAIGVVGGPTLAESRSAMTANTVSALYAFDLASAVDARHVIHLSTIYAADPAAYRGPAVYPISKRAGDDLLEAASIGSSTTVSVVRPTHVYDDAAECRAHQSALYRITDAARAGEPVSLAYPNGRRDYLHLDDLCRAMQTIVTERPPGRFTVRSPHARTFAEIATAAGVTTIHPATDADSSLGADVRLDCDPVVPGFTPSIDITDGVTRVMRRTPS